INPKNVLANLGIRQRKKIGVASVHRHCEHRLTIRSRYSACEPPTMGIKFPNAIAITNESKNQFTRDIEHHMRISHWNRKFSQYYVHVCSRSQWGKIGRTDHVIGDEGHCSSCVIYADTRLPPHEHSSWQEMRHWLRNIITRSGGGVVSCMIHYK